MSEEQTRKSLAGTADMGTKIGKLPQQQRESVYYGLRLQRNAVYLTPLGKRCVWVPRQHAATTYWFRYVRDADREHAVKSDRHDLELTPYNLRVLRLAEGVSSA